MVSGAQVGSPAAYILTASWTGGEFAVARFPPSPSGGEEECLIGMRRPVGNLRADSRVWSGAARTCRCWRRRQGSSPPPREGEGLGEGGARHGGHCPPYGEVSATPFSHPYWS